MFPLFVLHQPVIRRLSGGLVRHPRHHQTAERRRSAGPLQCDVIDDTIKMLNDDAALELFAWIIVALVAVVSCVRKTHICFMFACFWTLFTEHEAITTLSLGGMLFGERMAALSGRHHVGHSRADIFYAIHDAIRLLDDDAVWLSLLQVWV